MKDQEMKRQKILSQFVALNIYKNICFQEFVT